MLSSAHHLHARRGGGASYVQMRKRTRIGCRLRFDCTAAARLRFDCTVTSRLRHGYDTVTSRLRHGLIARLRHGYVRRRVCDAGSDVDDADEQRVRQVQRHHPTLHVARTTHPPGLSSRSNMFNVLLPPARQRLKKRRTALAICISCHRASASPCSTALHKTAMMKWTIATDCFW